MKQANVPAVSPRKDFFHDWPNTFEVRDEAAHQSVPGSEESGRAESVQEGAHQQLVPVLAGLPLVEQG